MLNSTKLPLFAGHHIIYKSSFLFIFSTVILQFLLVSISCVRYCAPRRPNLEAWRVGVEIITLFRYNYLMIKQILKKRNISVYKCSKLSGIPYTTLHELITSKSKFENCSIKTINKLATTLNIPISELIESELEYRMPFEEFKSELCHRLKRLGQINFIKNILLNDSISNYYNKGWYAEALYSLACLDYISKLNNIPLAKEYNAYRNKKLKKTISLNEQFQNS